MPKATQSQGSPRKKAPAKAKATTTPREETQQVINSFGELVSAATGKWKDNLGDLAVVSLVMLLLSVIPFANIAFLAGYIRALLKAARGEKPVVRDLFTAWDCFASMLVYVVIVAVVMIGVHFIPILGPLINTLISIVITPGLFAVADRNMEALDAFNWSFAVVKRNPMRWVLVVLVGGLLAAVGSVGVVIGLILTMPWGYMIVTLQYERDRSPALTQRS